VRTYFLADIIFVTIGFFVVTNFKYCITNDTIWMELILVATSKKHEIVKVTLLQLPQLKIDL